MKIKMKTLEAGPHGTFQPKDIVEMPKAMAEERIKGGYAEAAPDTARAKHVIEDAQSKAPKETAALRSNSAAAKPEGKKAPAAKPEGKKAPAAKPEGKKAPAAKPEEKPEGGKAA